MQYAEGTDEAVLFGRLMGATCDFCADGQLASGEYKGNTAMVCDTCGTPAVQVW
ncbi:HVO_A0556 family zinc finger protein [Haloterrigena sp. H1]|uniref:HVO_A0556 family zinc finger protein n=1 Tax=Haloterrigena sp. H1 TaxID=2552943 RepID=UPI0031B85A41